jgi:hypothetical protein
MKTFLMIFAFITGLLIGLNFTKTIYKPVDFGHSYGHAKITPLAALPCVGTVTKPSQNGGFSKITPVVKKNFITPESPKTPQITPEIFKVESPAKNQTEENRRDFVSKVPIKGSIKDKNFKLEFTGLTEVKLLGDDLYLNTTYQAKKLTLTESPWSVYAGLKWDGKLNYLFGVSYEKQLFNNLYGEISVSNVELIGKIKYKF